MWVCARMNQCLQVAGNTQKIVKVHVRLTGLTEVSQCQYILSRRTEKFPTPIVRGVDVQVEYMLFTLCYKKQVKYKNCVHSNNQMSRTNTVLRTQREASAKKKEKNHTYVLPLVMYSACVLDHCSQVWQMNYAIVRHQTLI